MPKTKQYKLLKSNRCKCGKFKKAGSWECVFCSMQFKLPLNDKQLNGRIDAITEGH